MSIYYKQMASKYFCKEDSCLIFCAVFQICSFIVYIHITSLSKKAKAMQDFRIFLQAKSPRQSFAARRRRNQAKICFFRGHVPRKNSSQPANVRAKRVRCSGLHPLSKMLAFLRSVSSFLDTLIHITKYYRACFCVVKR